MTQDKEAPQNHKIQLGMLIRNIILGGQDGLVNVLGIILGVATATSSTNIVLLAGLAATFAESVSMAAVAYTSSKAEQEHYESEILKETQEIEKRPADAREDVVTIYKEKGFSGKLLDEVVEKICSNKKLWLKTMMSEELGLQNPEDQMTPLKQGIIVGGSALIGSFVPLFPYFWIPVKEAILPSLIISLLLLFGGGAYKSHITSGKWLRGGLELMIIGGVAALAGYLVGVFFQVPVV
ncbi:VIT1/CCC1 transporter family protein [Candidatus Micrarchaeota archaeon]|nr:VIT1/CCC1 transporter family protein [Candidatus Micrarchaeota archaeon]